MLLRPRKFFYKNFQKKRSFKFFKRLKLSYGIAGLYLLQPLKLTSKQIFKYKLFLKKSTRKSDKTLRFMWFNIFPHLPLTRKVEGSRMGKGKGKLTTWLIEISAGNYLFEFKNLRSGRLKYFLNQISLRLPAKTRIYFLHTKRHQLIYINQKKISYDVFW